MTTLVREPVVAGVFYPATAADLEVQVLTLMTENSEQHDLLACVAPHAGYVYSGGVAGQLYSHLRIPRRVVVIGPNHTGLGAKIAVAPHGAWSTPLGRGTIDRGLAERVLAETPRAELDARAHWREHSLEVQLPFLQLRRPDVEVLPITVSHLTFDECRDLGSALARTIKEVGDPVGLVASSDMTHYEPDEVAREFDGLAIDAALGLDPEAFYRTVHDRRISMCGVIPTTVVLTAALELGANDAHLVAYATSGDVSGDRTSVVGYAGLCFHTEA